MVDLKKYPFPPGYNAQSLPDFIDDVINFYSDQTAWNDSVSECLMAIKSFTIQREKQHEQREKELDALINNLEYRLKAIENWAVVEPSYKEKLSKHH